MLANWVFTLVQIRTLLKLLNVWWHLMKRNVDKPSWGRGLSQKFQYIFKKCVKVNTSLLHEISKISNDNFNKLRNYFKYQLLTGFWTIWGITAAVGFRSCKRHTCCLQNRLPIVVKSINLNVPKHFHNYVACWLAARYPCIS